MAAVQSHPAGSPLSFSWELQLESAGTLTHSPGETYRLEISDQTGLLADMVHPIRIG
jgi:hypothetical protein